ncbi:MAG: hypothetical protein P0Y53_23285 [Candidatus Pseudobacter hemicellulosilyticus]|uniref:Uncharacterized protein n=1 Tax=Candidatus Pseudobacter hemicellulosilyticus TaxID=3121375 RepID=A0AAJ5WRM3_9BACT|nr:MAG: hypothetical protein P0Y53_23285 [Pseudobacter sp.]
MPTVFYTCTLILVLSLLACFGIYWLLRRQPLPVARLSRQELLIAFGYKLLFGCGYGYIFLRYFGGDDTWMLNNSSLFEQDRLLQDPWLFLDDLKPWLAFQRNPTFISGLNNLLGDLEYQTISKSLAIFNFISGGNYYINIVFFSFITFWGHYWLFSLLVKLYPARRRWLFGLIFFFPPVVFWLSGIRGDGLLFFFFALTLLQFHKWLQDGRKTALAGVLLGLFGVMVYRSQVAMVLFPALAAWAWTVRGRQKAWLCFGITWLLSLLLFFASSTLPGKLNLPASVAEKQHDYQVLNGNTRYALEPLEPSVSSYVQVFPQAVLNSFFRPFPWEARGPLQVLAALDGLLFWLLAALLVWQWWKSGRQLSTDPLLWTLFCFGITLYIFIGYTVPFPGAIVRYKIVPELGFYTCWMVLLRPFSARAGNTVGRTN